MTFDCDIPESLCGFATRPRQEKNGPIYGGPTHDVTHPRKKPESAMTNVIHDGWRSQRAQLGGVKMVEQRMPRFERHGQQEMAKRFRIYSSGTCRGWAGSLYSISRSGCKQFNRTRRTTWVIIRKSYLWSGKKRGTSNSGVSLAQAVL